MGYEGDAGAAGPMGMKGTSGIDGEAGIQGETGAKGSNVSSQMSVFPVGGIGNQATRTTIVYGFIQMFTITIPWCVVILGVSWSTG